MGFIDKFRKALQPDDGDFDGTPDEMSYDYENEPIIRNNNDIYGNGGGYNDMQGGEDNMTPPNISIGGNGSSHASVELKVLKPRAFDEVEGIADHLLSGKTVILNIEETSKETTRRLIDFLAGVAYSIGGDLERVANTFIITPNGIPITSEQLKKATNTTNTTNARNNSKDLFE